MPRVARFAHLIGTAKKAALLAGPAAILLGAGTAHAAAMPSAHLPASATSQLSAASHGRGPAATLELASRLRHGLVMARLGAGAARVSKAAGNSRDHARRPATKSHGQGRRPAASRRHVVRRGPLAWNQVARIQALRADPRLGRSPLPAADRLRPVAQYGPQEHMQLDSAQVGNATTIVHQALAKKMGVRSAVIAVATAMQESELNDVNYGTSDSLGLFQQRPSCGWGTAQQILHPAYAADAFLNALQRYQAANPGWASQPLYAAAQGVQASAFPTAYAKWEAQAAGLVKTITVNQTR